MPQYTPPLRDMQFVLHEMLNVEAELAKLPEHEDIDAETVDAVLEEGGKFYADILQPLNAVGDREGCKLDADGNVTTPTGFRDAYQQYVAAGWPSLAADVNYGGQGLPHLLSSAFMEMINSSNQAWGMYPGLSHGAYTALLAFGTDALKDLYLPKLVSGEWTGTMCLTEPHCGTDLGILKTKADDNGDGSYAISGTKIFISAGEHDMADNIVHLVLARLPDAPEGTKGISLFVVPKFLPDADGNPGERNGVKCGSLEHKMGIHGNATAVLNFDGARGFLVGELHKGMRAMFTMMNEARLGVGIQGLSQSEVAYQNAVTYARERLQGRALAGPADPEKPADPIIVHPDIRRMLMNMKAFNEAARALVLWTAIRGDISHRGTDEAERQAADDLMGLMTPVIKGVLTDTGFKNAVDAQQVYGGHGYIAEWGMEQFVRDARIAMIYEGANGIQALDLVGRKLPAKGGRAVMAFFGEVEGFLKANAEDEAMAPYAKPLKTGLETLQQATIWFMNNAMTKPDNAGAGSTDYMHLFGLVALGYMWAQMAKVAQAKLADGADNKAFYETKLATGRYFMDRVMPEAQAHLARIQSGSDSMMALSADAF